MGLGITKTNDLGTGLLFASTCTFRETIHTDSHVLTAPRAKEAKHNILAYATTPSTSSAIRATKA
jgi:hypothetical protein